MKFDSRRNAATNLLQLFATIAERSDFGERFIRNLCKNHARLLCGKAVRENSEILNVKSRVFD